MSNYDRRELLQTGLAMLPLASLSFLSGGSHTLENSTDGRSNKSNNKPNPEGKEKMMQVKYLEIVSPEADALCELYAKIHGVKFSDPVANFGNARTAKLEGGGMVGFRKPMHGQEKPATRTYTLVKDLKKAVAAAKEAGAEMAIESMDMPGGGGKIAIFFHGGIETGLWEV